MYRVYRSIRKSNIDHIDLDNIGISWAKDESSAEMHADQFMEKYIILSAIVNVEQIDIPQTNGQWESEYANENEVVLKPYQDIILEFRGKKYRVNTGHGNNNDETRPEPIECDPTEITDYLEKV
ncbi:MAG: hypothetical protein ACOC22_01920 [bacterium]